eukprot:TRINITY_DN21686_c0_g1_i1.p1 TRINITY_DN21686_c0_g1~~TRINITY_DN21686_c0_g1_i1.p1  ORF type:complete len:1145 (+),score=268.69 TRINITY_DN21686_c0_g1_i1:35-3436(+)
MLYVGAPGEVRLTARRAGLLTMTADIVKAAVESDPGGGQAGATASGEHVDPELLLMLFTSGLAPQAEAKGLEEGREDVAPEAEGCSARDEAEAAVVPAAGSETDTAAKNPASPAAPDASAHAALDAELPVEEPADVRAGADGAATQDPSADEAQSESAVADGAAAEAEATAQQPAPSIASDEGKPEEAASAARLSSMEADSAVEAVDAVTEHPVRHSVAALEVDRLAADIEEVPENSVGDSAAALADAKDLPRQATEPEHALAATLGETTAEVAAVPLRPAGVEATPEVAVEEPSRQVADSANAPLEASADEASRCCEEAPAEAQDVVGPPQDAEAQPPATEQATAATQCLQPVLALDPACEKREACSQATAEVEVSKLADAIATSEPAAPVASAEHCAEAATAGVEQQPSLQTEQVQSSTAMHACEAAGEEAAGSGSGAAGHERQTSLQAGSQEQLLCDASQAVASADPQAETADTAADVEIPLTEHRSSDISPAMSQEAASREAEQAVEQSANDTPGDASTDLPDPSASAEAAMAHVSDDLPEQHGVDMADDVAGDLVPEAAEEAGPAALQGGQHTAEGTDEAAELATTEPLPEDSNLDADVSVPPVCENKAAPEVTTAGLPKDELEMHEPPSNSEPVECETAAPAGSEADTAQEPAEAPQRPAAQDELPQALAESLPPAPVAASSCGEEAVISEAHPSAGAAASTHDLSTAVEDATGEVRQDADASAAGQEETPQAEGHVGEGRLLQDEQQDQAAAEPSPKRARCAEEAETASNLLEQELAAESAGAGPVGSAATSEQSATDSVAVPPATPASALSRAASRGLSGLSDIYSSTVLPTRSVQRSLSSPTRGARQLGQSCRGGGPGGSAAGAAAAAAFATAVAAAGKQENRHAFDATDAAATSAVPEAPEVARARERAARARARRSATLQCVQAAMASAGAGLEPSQASSAVPGGHPAPQPVASPVRNGAQQMRSLARAASGGHLPTEETASGHIPYLADLGTSSSSSAPVARGRGRSKKEAGAIDPMSEAIDHILGRAVGKPPCVRGPGRPARGTAAESVETLLLSGSAELASDIGVATSEGVAEGLAAPGRKRGKAVCGAETQTAPAVLQNSVREVPAKKPRKAGRKLQW